MPIFLIVIIAIAAALAWGRRHPSPFPVAMTGMLEHPLRRRVMDPEAVVRGMALGPGMRVLEIGPGGGMFTAVLARQANGAAIVCLDVQPGMVEKVRTRLGERAAGFACGDAAALPLAEQSIDRILLVSVLGEVPDRAAALRECFRVLRPGGIAVIAEALPDPDFIPPRRLAREAREAGFAASTRTGPWASYTQAFVRPG